MSNAPIVLDRGLLFSAAFATTGPFASAEVAVGDTRTGTAVMVQAVGVGVTIDVQAKDPETGAYHTVQSHTTTSNTTDVVAVPNLGSFALAITPASATGSARIWCVPQGGAQ